MSFGVESTFGECFPEVAAMRVEVVETRLPFGRNAVRVFTLDDPPTESVGCREHLCCCGGLDLGELLRGLVRRRSSTYSGVVSCVGYRGSPKGHRRYGRCPNRFAVSASLTFAEQ